MVALAKPDNLIQFSQKSNEWFTPSRYIEAARAVMGSVDLDPASCELANRTVRAKRFYTQRENGLEQSWHGNVWCNPPYNATGDCRYPQPVWSRKLQHEYRQGNVEQAILLTTASPKQNWFHELLAYLVCFCLERIFFERPGKAPEELRHGTCFTYFGPHEQRFIDIFSQFGTVAKRVSPLKVESINLSLWEVQ